MAPLRPKRDEEKTAYEKWQEERATRKRPDGPVRAIPQTQHDRGWQPSKTNSKGYNWEKELLGNIKGKSYNDKFDKLMDSMGVGSTQRMGFRNWLDDMENSEERRKNDEKIFQEQTNTNFEGAMINAFKGGKNFSYEDNVGTRTWKNGEEDRFIPTGTKEDKPFSRYASEREKLIEQQRERIQEEQAKESEKGQKAAGLFESGLGKELASRVMRAGKTNTDDILAFLTGEKSFSIGDGFRDREEGDTFSSYNQVGKVREGENPNQLDRFLARASNSAGLGLREQIQRATGDDRSVDAYYNDRDFGEGGGTDLIADLLGYAVPGVGAAKAVRGTKLGAQSNTIGQWAKEGAVVGAGMSGAEVGARELLNPDEYTWQQNLGQIALETAGGAVLDPLVGVIGRGISSLRAKGVQNPTPEQLAEETGVDPFEIVNRVMGDFDGTNPVNREATGDVIDPNQPRLTGRTADDPLEQLTGPTAETPRLGDDPLALDTPNVRYEPRGVGQEVEIEGTPLLESPRVGPSSITEDELLDEFTRVQGEIENARQTFVDERMVEVDRQMEEVLQGEDQWNLIQQSGQRRKEVKNTLGGNNRIYIDPSINSDWKDRVPKVLRAAKPGSGKVDIYQAAEMLGYPGDNTGVEQMLNELENIYSTVRTRKQDVVPQGSVLSPKKYEEIQNNIIREFEESDTYKQLDALLQELIETGKRNEMYANEQAQTTGDPLRFVTQKLFQNEEILPEPFTRQVNHSDLVTQRAEGNYNTTPTNDGIRMNFPEDEILEDLGFRQQIPFEQTRQPIEDNYVGQGRQSVDGEAPQPENDPFLMRSNLQYHNNTDNLSDSMVNTSPNNLEPEQMTNLRSNPVRRLIDKAYEAIINKRHGLHVGDAVVTERALKDAQKQLDDAITKGQSTKALQSKVNQLSKRLKNIKKSGSQLEKASANEDAIYSRTMDMVNRHLGSMYSKLKKSNVEIKDALHYLMAKNLDHILTKDKDFGLPPDWTYERLRTIIDTVERGKPERKAVIEGFAKDFKGYMDEMRQFMLDYGLKTPEEIDLLSQNDFYVPLFRDKSWRTTHNVDRTSNRGNANRLDAKAYLFDLEGGNQTDYFKNPFEAIIEMNHMIVRQGYKNDTAKELYKLAEMDIDGNMVRFAREGDKDNIVTGYHNGERFDLVVSDDVFDIITQSHHPKETIQAAQKLKKAVDEVTRQYAGLKTRSLSHQLVAAPRDLFQGFINSQTNNPFTYLGELIHAVRSGHMDAKQVGGTFQQGYNDHTGGAGNHQKLVDDFKKELGIKETDISKPKEVAQTIKKLLDSSIFAPARILGQQSDNVVRNVEVRLTERKYQREQQMLEQELNNMPPETEFETPELAVRRKELTDRLAEIPDEMRREMTYQARDMMNYQRTGRSKIVSDIIKPYVIFANTTTQSKDKFFRSFVKNPGGVIAKLAVPVGGMAAIQQHFYNEATPEQKEKVDLAPDYIKQYYWMFPVGDDFITLPKPHEAVPIISAIEAGMNQALNQQQVGSDWNELARLVVKEYVPLQMGNFAQGIIPDRFGERGNVNLPSTLPTLGANIMANEKLDFNRKPISYGSDYQGETNFFIPDGMTQEDVSADYTSPTAQALSGDVVNANYTDYAIRQLLGDLGKYGLGAGDLAIQASRGNTSPDDVLELLRQMSIDGYLRPAYADREKEDFLKR